MVFHSEKKDNNHDQRKDKECEGPSLREANGKEERGLHLQHQLAEIAQDLGAGEDKSHQNCMLGGPLDLEGRECELLAAPDRELASKQQPDTTIGMQL